MQQGVRFDPDMPQTIRLEFAKSNTKVSKPKQPAAAAATSHPALMHPLTGRKYLFVTAKPSFFFAFISHIFPKSLPVTCDLWPMTPTCLLLLLLFLFTTRIIRAIYVLGVVFFFINFTFRHLTADMREYLIFTLLKSLFFVLQLDNFDVFERQISLD